MPWIHGVKTEKRLLSLLLSDIHENITVSVAKYSKLREGMLYTDYYSIAVMGIKYFEKSQEIEFNIFSSPHAGFLYKMVWIFVYDNDTNLAK